MAMIPENPVVGGTVLRRQAIESPNFVTGSTGWAVNQDGSAEFNNVVIRNGQVVSGTALYYSGPPAAGNLVASVAAAAGTDVFGNAYLGGVSAYSQAATFAACQLLGGIVTFYTAGSQAGPWVPRASISGDTANNLKLTAQGLGQIQANNLLAALQGATVAQGATVTGGITADTEVITSGQAAGLLLDITNTTTPASGALERLTVAGAGDTFQACRVSGDTTPRLQLGMTAAGLAQILMGPGNAAFDTIIRRLSPTALGILGADLAVDTAGSGLQVKEGTNAKQGTAVLVGGTVVVSNTAVTANSRIFLTAQNTGGTPGALRVSARTAGTSFTITSTSATDTSTVAYQIFEPAP